MHFILSIGRWVRRDKFRNNQPHFRCSRLSPFALLSVHSSININLSHFFFFFHKSTMTRALTFIIAARVIDGKTNSARPFVSDEELRSFKAHYGARPRACVVLFCKLRLVDCRPSITHLLWALSFLKTYASEDVLASKFGTTRKTLRKHIWAIVPKCTMPQIGLEE